MSGQRKCSRMSASTAYTLTTMNIMAFWLSSICSAEVRLSGVFGDHGVLQRDRPVPVFGTAASGEKVIVMFHGQSQSATADAQGEWFVKLAAMKADATGQPLTVAGANTLTIKDVVVGDVWLCSGQSNMDMRLGGCERPADIASADFAGIRHFSVPTASSAAPLKSVKGQWSVCTPRSASSFSATAFYFARKVQRELKGAIPIGLLVASVGGTSVASISHYTFDPLKGSHMFEALFSKKAPSYTITATAEKGGKLLPAGAVTVTQGASATFAIEPDAGNRVSLSVDGLALGARQAYTFSDVFVYKVALTDAERKQLETHIAKTLTE